MGTHQNRLVEAVLMSTHNLCFEQKYENYVSFLSRNFEFLKVKFSIHLIRRVFVMIAHAWNDLCTLCMLKDTFFAFNPCPAE